MSDDVIDDLFGSTKPLPANIVELANAALKPGDACAIFCEKCQSIRGLTGQQLAEEGIDAKGARFKLLTGCPECPGAE